MCPQWCAGLDKSKPGSVTNEVVHHMDWLPTFLAAAGNPDITEQLLDGVTVDEMAGREYRVHLDGYNLMPHLTGEVEESPRKEIFYFSDDGDLTALRYDDWKMIFMEQREVGTFAVWQYPFVPLRVPYIYNLRRDPYERSTITSNMYYEWLIDRAYLLVPAQAYVGKFLATFQEYPPRQQAASFSLDKVLETLRSRWRCSVATASPTTIGPPRHRPWAGHPSEGFFDDRQTRSNRLHRAVRNAGLCRPVAVVEPRCGQDPDRRIRGRGDRPQFERLRSGGRSDRDLRQ